MVTPRHPSLLVVDDDREIFLFFETLLGGDHDLRHAATAEEATRLFDGKKFDAVLLDIDLPDGSGLDLLRQFKEKDPYAKIMMITGDIEVQTVVEAMRDGAFNYLAKPFSVELVRDALDKALDHRDLQNRVTYLEHELDQCFSFEGMFGQEPRMLELYAQIGNLADSDSTVLIHGESGTGKELVARAIHSQSARRARPFVVVNCAAIPNQLMESLLFGHAKGAFTGATTDQIGKLELADGGTAFLDDVDSLDPLLQAKLLRVLQEKEFERVGTHRIIKVDIRFVAASNQDLKALIEEQRFREDLYYRLNVLPIDLPPLRERRGDIPLLVAHFAERHARKRHGSPKRFTPPALDVLEAYPWPGNVRELENQVEYLCTAFHDQEIDLKHLPPHLIGGSERVTLDLRDASRSFEKRHIEKVLADTGGNRSKAAKILGIHRNTLLAKIGDLGIDL
jgi:DNA-binding NtrC family response regulator